MPPPKCVLVTGGAGFVGSHLVEHLTGAGLRVVVFDDLTRGSLEWLPDEVEVHEGDVRDPRRVADVIGGVRPDAVAHLAALHYIPDVDDAPDLARAINVDGTRNVLDACRHALPDVVVFASTAAVYPKHDGALDESVPPAPIDVYGETKLEGERLLASFAAETGTRAAAARIFNVVGPRETNPHVVPEIVEQVRSGADEIELGNVEPKRDLTDVRDTAAALASLILRAPDGFSVFNVGTGRALSVREVVDICADVTGRPLRIRQVPHRIRAVERQMLVADARALTGATGWRPQHDIRDTLAELLAG